MVKCSFCGKEEKPYIGIHVVRNIGVVNYYCSSKCRKNAMKLQRDKRKLKWTEAFHQTRDKAIDKAESNKQAAEAEVQETAHPTKAVASKTRKIGVKKIAVK